MSVGAVAFHFCFVIFGDSHSFHVRRRNPTNSATIYIYIYMYMFNIHNCFYFRFTPMPEDTQKELCVLHWLCNRFDEKEIRGDAKFVGWVGST